MKKYRVTGKNLKHVLSNVAEKLKVKEEDLEYNIIEEEKSFFITKKIIMEVWVRPKENPNTQNISSSETKNELKKIEEKNIEKEEKNFFIIDDVIKLRFDKNGVYMKILNPEIDFPDIVEFLGDKYVDTPNMDKVNEAYSNINKEIKIAEYYEGMYNEAELELDISEEKDKAEIFIKKPRGANLPSLEDIKKFLADNKVVFGILEEEIKNILINKRLEEKIVVAESKKPEKGKDAEIKMYIKSVDAKDNIAPSVDENGKVNFKNLSLVESIKEGDVLAEKIPAEEGKIGKNIFGEEISAEKGNDKKLPLGKNTELSEDGMKLISKINGMVNYIDEKINIMEVYVLDEVGLATGNIEFEGSVVIKGDVAPDYEIRAKGLIEVGGNIEKAKLYSETDIILKGSCFGKNEGILNAKNDIILNFAEAVTIEAGGNIIANEGIMNSNIFSGNKISVIDKKGVIVGGIIKAAKGIEVINLGSPHGVKTEIEVGSDPRILEKIKKYENEIDDLEEKLKETEKTISLLEKIKKTSGGKLEEDKEDIYEKMILARNTMSAKVIKNKAKINKLETEMKDVKNASVNIRGICYSGVKIKIRKASYIVREDIMKAKFYYEDGELKLTSL